MVFFEIFVAVTFFCLGGVMTRLFQLKIRRRKQAIFLYQSGYCLVASLSFLVFGGVDKPGAATLIFGVIFGILFAAAMYFNSECFECGPMSLSSLIMNLSMAIPMVYSLVVFNERITLTQIGGLILLAATFILSSGCSSQDKNSAVSVKWIIMAFISFAANGFTAVIQKQHNYTVGPNGMFMCSAYFTAAVCFACAFLIGNKGEKFKFSKNFSGVWPLLMVTLPAGVGNCIGNGLLGNLSVRVDAAVLYPSINGGLAIMASIASFLLFSEKLTRRKLLSLIIGVAAIVMLAL